MPRSVKVNAPADFAVDRGLVELGRGRIQPRDTAGPRAVLEE